LADGCSVPAVLVVDDKNTPYFGRLMDHVRDIAFLVETGNDDGKMHGKRA
jgi:hypothetical protein